MQPIDEGQQDSTITDQIQTLQDALNHAQAQRTFDDVGGSQSPLEKENFFFGHADSSLQEGSKAFFTLPGVSFQG